MGNVADIRNMRAFLRPVGTALEAKRDSLGISRVDAARQIGISIGAYNALEDATAGSPHLRPVIAALDWLGLRLTVQPKESADKASIKPHHLPPAHNHTRAATAKDNEP